jgi:hypothetical protein
MNGFFDTSVLVPVFYGDHVLGGGIYDAMLAHCAIKVKAVCCERLKSLVGHPCGP